MGDTKTPLLTEYSDFKGTRLIYLGLSEAIDPMIAGQKIKKGEIEPTNENKQYAIGTPSMDTTPKALAFGTIGHILERSYFNWARENGFEPENGWQKDMFLHAAVEMVMLHLAADDKYIIGENPLIDCFMLKNEKGGLGWLNEKKVNQFKEGFWDVLAPKEPRE